MSDQASNQEHSPPEQPEAEPAGADSGDRTDEQARQREGEPTLEELRAQADENWNKYLRVVAELDNLRKRSARELENARKFSIESLAAEILPVRDSIEAALTSAENVDVETLLEGERATLRLLDQALASAGVREIDPHGEPFDPTRHEAIGMLASESAEANTVLEVVQKGYAIHERIMRPARVIVAREPDA